MTGGAGEEEEEQEEQEEGEEEEEEAIWFMTALLLPLLKSDQCVCLGHDPEERTLAPHRRPRVLSERAHPL